MKKIALILVVLAFAHNISYSQIRYDDGPIGDGSGPIGEFTVSGTIWNKRFITYYFQSITADIPQQNVVKSAVRRAFSTWQAQTRLYFIEACSALDADIVISWEVGDHGDGYPFSGSTLAHAFYPPPNSGSLAGDIHFNDTFDWKVAGNVPYDVETVALHEMGHSLGLAHTNVSNSTMEPVYAGVRTYLGSDDIAGIRSIYGSAIDFISVSNTCVASYFSINEVLPAGYSVQWSGATSTSPNGSSAYSTNGGSGMVTATLTNGCGSAVFTKVFTSLGTPYIEANYSDGRTSGKPMYIYLPNNTTPNDVCIGYNSSYYVDGYVTGMGYVTWSIPIGYATTAFSIRSIVGNRVYFDWNYGGITPIGYLRASANNGCGTDSKIFAFRQVNCGTGGGGGGTPDPCAIAKAVNYFKISPNPASDIITIGAGDRPIPISCPSVKALSTESGIAFSEVNIYNHLGKLVKSYETKDTKNASISISSLVAGLYLVEIKQGDYIERQQIIIEK